MRGKDESTNSQSTSMTSTNRLAQAASKEFYWGAELTKEEPSVTWTFEEEEDDQDYLEHTLFLRHAVLGPKVPDGERNVVQVETKPFSGEDIKQPILSLIAGRKEMCKLDLNFGHEIPVTFRLVDGSGPVYISAQHLVEFPQELDDSLDYTATETELETEEEGMAAKPPMKRKMKATGGRRKRGKIEDAEEDDDDDEEEEGDENESMEAEEDTEDGTEESEEAGDDDEEEEAEEEDSEESEDEPPKKKGAKGKKVTKLAAKATKQKAPTKGRRSAKSR